MTNADIEKLALEVQRVTAMSRLTLVECRAVIALMLDHGFTLTPPAPKAAK
jgi:hypothetical protein